MAAKTPVGAQRGCHQLASVLSSAVLEWFLILLLFVDALLSYLVTKFARCCKLKDPCLFCSRLDHILGNEKAGFYSNLICNAHKLEISSWAFCQDHQRLADIHEMCEGCLVSFAKKMKFDKPEICISLMNKLWVVNEYEEDVNFMLPASMSDVEDVKIPDMKKDSEPKCCSCCFQLFGDNPHDIRFLKSKPISTKVAEISISSSGHNHQNDKGGLTRSLKKLLGAVTNDHSKSHAFYLFSDVGYSELKTTSNAESETEASISDDGRTAPAHVNDPKDDVLQSLQPDPVGAIPNRSVPPPSVDMATKKLIQTSTMPKPSISTPEKTCHQDEHHDLSSSASGSIRHGLEELNWNQVEVVKGSSLSEGAPQVEMKEASHTEIESVEVGASASISATSSGEVCMASNSNEVNLKTCQILNATVHIPLDLNDAYKLAISSKGSLPSPAFTDIITGRDSSRIHEDLRLLLSQISASRGLEFPWNDMAPSPRLQGHSDEYKSSDAFSSAVLQNISKKLSIERNEFGMESIDGSVVSEIEGESPVDRLKRQIELDRKSMSLLYKELEEERNASAIAANQAMAMITRLQEEKAAMQMEALQYQRMMEEQAEYDLEALQRLNELLTQREKEIQDLEEELVRYRKRFQDEPLSDKFVEPFDDLEATEKNITGTPLDKGSLWHGKSLQEDVVALDLGSFPPSHLRDSFLDFEEEKIHIAECLNKLEKKLILFSNDGVYVDESRPDCREDVIHDRKNEHVNGVNHKQGYAVVDAHVASDGHCSDEEAGSSDLDYPYSGDMAHNNKQVMDSAHVKDSSVSPRGIQLVNKEKHEEKLYCSGPDGDAQYPANSRNTNFTAVKSEISHLNKRLVALEADRNFIEHVINSLRSGNDGMQFVREIACYLRELRQIGITRGLCTVP